MFRQTLSAACAMALSSPCCLAQAHRDPAHGSPAADIVQTAKQWRLDHSTFNPAVMPCDDFYEHVCGGWDAPGRIPADQSKADWATDAAGKTNDVLIDQLLTGKLLGGNSERDRLHVFYGSCMSQDAETEQSANAALQSLLKKIDEIGTRQQFLAAWFDLQVRGVNAFLTYSGQPDRGDRTRYRGEIAEGTTGLTAGYTNTDPKAAEPLRKYRRHIARMLILAGAAPATAAGQSEAIFGMESALTAQALSLSDKFDPQKSENPTSASQLAEAAPHIDWGAYLKFVGAPADRPVNVLSPGNLHDVDALLAATSLTELKAFLRWQILLAYGPALPARFVSENQRYWQPAGVKPESRSSKCRLETIKALGVELSRQFALQFVGNKARQEATDATERVQSEVIKTSGRIAWLSAEGRAASERRLRTLDLKVGYPEEWPATGDFALGKKAHLENVIGAQTFEQKRSWDRARAPRNRKSWEMTVYPNAAPGMAAARLMIPNGYPDVFTNSLLIMAAWLRPPLFDASAPAGVRYGSFGTFVGHELGHVLENHEFDANGEMNETWTAADIAADSEQNACMIRQASEYSTREGLHFDGTQTLEENVADLSGTVHAFSAMSHELGESVWQEDADGLTPARQFFIAYAQRHCTAQRPDYFRQSLREDGHAPNRFRVNAPLSNMQEFARAFSCPSHAAMVRPAESKCLLWGL